MPVRLREQGLRDDFIAAYDELQTLLGREWGIDYACQRNICSFSAFCFLDTFFMVGYSDIFEMLLFRVLRLTRPIVTPPGFTLGSR
jgi:hypothetical protein